MADAREAAIEREPELAGHPGPRQYVEVAIVLAIATALEVGMYYITDIPRALYIALLIFFMMVKFALVVLWFMHLRFDNRLFRRLFVTGLGLAIAVYVIVLVIFGALPAAALLWAILLGIGAILGVVLLGMARAGRRRAGATGAGEG